MKPVSVVYVRTDKPQTGGVYHTDPTCQKVSWPGLAPNAYMPVPRWLAERAGLPRCQGWNRCKKVA